MSSSDDTNVETESPLFIKSRPVPRKESSSEPDENNSEPEESADESGMETDDETETSPQPVVPVAPKASSAPKSKRAPGNAEKSPQPVVPVAPKASSAPKSKRAPGNAVKSKTYDRMVYEAMEKLNETRRLGVSIQRIVKYVNENYDIPSNRVKLYCKKAIDKGLKENVYVHTSGVGLSGSIVFSADSWNDLKKAQKKALKAAETNKKPKPTAKLKAKPKQKVGPKTKAAKQPKVDTKSKNAKPQKNMNNNPTVGTAAAKKTKKPMRVSLPTTKAKPKSKAAPIVRTNKAKSTAKTSGKAVPSTKGRKGAVTTRSKSVDK